MAFTYTTTLDFFTPGATPQGMTIRGGKAYVADNFSGMVRVYDGANDWAYQEDESFEVHADNTNMQAIDVDVGMDRAWVLDATDRRIYVYQLSTGLRRDLEEWTFTGGSRSGLAIDIDQDLAFICDRFDNAGVARAFRLSTGDALTGQDIDLSHDVVSAIGLTILNGVLYVPDDDTNNIVAFNIADGSHNERESFEVTSANTAPRSIATDGLNLFVADAIRRVFGYSRDPEFISMEGQAGGGWTGDLSLRVIPLTRLSMEGRFGGWTGDVASVTLRPALMLSMEGRFGGWTGDLSPRVIPLLRIGMEGQAGGGWTGLMRRKIQPWLPNPALGCDISGFIGIVYGVDIYDGKAYMAGIRSSDRQNWVQVYDLENDCALLTSEGFRLEPGAESVAALAIRDLSEAGGSGVLLYVMDNNGDLFAYNTSGNRLSNFDVDRPSSLPGSGWGGLAIDAEQALFYVAGKENFSGINNPLIWALNHNGGVQFSFATEFGRDDCVRGMTLLGDTLFAIIEDADGDQRVYAFDATDRSAIPDQGFKPVMDGNGLANDGTNLFLVSGDDQLIGYSPIPTLSLGPMEGRFGGWTATIDLDVFVAGEWIPWAKLPQATRAAAVASLDSDLPMVDVRVRAVGQGFEPSLWAQLNGLSLPTQAPAGNEWIPWTQLPQATRAAAIAGLMQGDTKDVRVRAVGKDAIPSDWVELLGVAPGSGESADWLPWGVLPQETPQADIPGLQSGESYDFRVRAVRPGFEPSDWVELTGIQTQT